jgi:hypothetical protein
MTLDVALALDAEQELRRRAAAAGKDVSVIASELLTQALTFGARLTRERLLEISGTSYKHFVESGVSDEQLAEELEDAKHAARAAKRGTPFAE